MQSRDVLCLWDLGDVMVRCCCDAVSYFILYYGVMIMMMY